MVTDLYDALPAERTSLLPGHTAVFPIAIAADTRAILTVRHDTDTTVQDWTLRAWISRQINGSPVIFKSSADWIPDRYGEVSIAIHNARLSKSAHPRTLSLAEGDYFLCVTSNTNAVNGFSISLTPNP